MNCVLLCAKLHTTGCITSSGMRGDGFHATRSKEICAKCDLLKPQPAERSRPRGHGSKKRPLIRRPPPLLSSSMSLLLLLLFVKLRQINLQYPSNAFNSPLLSPSLARSDKLPNPSFLDLFPLRLPLRLTVMSLAGRSPPFGGDGMITSQKVSL